MPKFWIFIEDMANQGIISIPERVFEEITEIDDELADWVRQRRNTPLVTDPHPQVQLMYGQIGDHVHKHYEYHRAEEFLDGADAWLIAHAKVLGGCVVTKENKVGIGAKKVKIPNICADFGVPVKLLWALIEERNASFA